MSICTDVEYQRAWADWREADYYLGLHPIKAEVRVYWSQKKSEARLKMDERESALQKA